MSMIKSANGRYFDPKKIILISVYENDKKMFEAQTHFPFHLYYTIGIFETRQKAKDYLASCVPEEFNKKVVWDEEFYLGSIDPNTFKHAKYDGQKKIHIFFGDDEFEKIITVGDFDLIDAMKYIKRLEHCAKLAANKNPDSPIIAASVNPRGRHFTVDIYRECGLIDTVARFSLRKDADNYLCKAWPHSTNFWLTMNDGFVCYKHIDALEIKDDDHRYAAFALLSSGLYFELGSFDTMEEANFYLKVVENAIK